MQYCIRAVDAVEYADEIRAFDRQFKDWMYPIKPDDIDECWIVFADDVPVGYAALLPSQNWPLTGYLARCGVIAAHRGNGLQRRLIRVREASARRQGWQWMLSDTVANPVSMNNLIRSGYTTFEPRKRWGAANAVYWRKYIGGGVKSEMPR